MKYKERAKEILNTSTDHHNGNLNLFYIDDIIKSMCQLAEEVDLLKTIEAVKTFKKINDKHWNELINMSKNLYSKEQVEELLKKQKESDAENAYYYDINGNKISCKDEVLENNLIIF